MEYIRLVHWRYWDKRRKNFQTLAFQNSSESKAVSVVDKECTERDGRDICTRLNRFYAKYSPCFAVWIFDARLLPEGAEFTDERSDSGDECHRNLRGLSDSQAKSFFKRHTRPNTLKVLLYCGADGSPQPLTDQLADELCDRFGSTETVQQ